MPNKLATTDSSNVWPEPKDEIKQSAMVRQAIIATDPGSDPKAATAAFNALLAAAKANIQRTGGTAPTVAIQQNFDGGLPAWDGEDEEARYIVPTLTHVARFFNVATQTAMAWRSDGLPGDRNTYDLRECYRFLHPRDPSTGRVVRRNSFEEGTREDAERRIKLADAGMKELRLQTKQGEVIPRTMVQQILLSIGTTLRKVGAQLEKECGGEALQIINEGLEDYRRQMTAFLESLNDSDGEADSDDSGPGDVD